MVDLTIADGKLLVNVRGVDKILSFKSSLEIPVEHIIGIRSDPAIAKEWWKGWRFPGTGIPGVITAGTYYKDGQRVFWDVHNPDKAVVINLRDETFDRLVVETEDPQIAISLVRNVIANANR